MDYMQYIWLALIVVFGIVEASTANLVTIWFAVGSAAALIGSFLGAPVWLQIVLFIAVSAAVLLLLRPLAKKFINGKKQPTNADRVLGAVCPVTEDIDNVMGTGAVSVDGKQWSARTADGTKIPRGDLVRTMYIQGVKLIVEKVS